MTVSVEFFYCHRDGVTISTINGDILRKLLFSNVLDRLCPEIFLYEIAVIASSDNTVEYFPNHKLIILFLKLW